RREQRAVVVLAEDRERLGAKLRREVDDVGRRNSLALERRGLRREGLARGRLLSRDRGLRHWTILDGPDRLARRAIEHVDEPLLGDLRHGANPPAVHRDVDEIRRGRERSEEHTSELQSRFDLVCRLLLEKKK